MSLPKWPQKPKNLGLGAYWETYERSRAEAAIARLKVAVEALRKYESIVVMYQDEDNVAGRSFAWEALKAIGEIPE